MYASVTLEPTLSIPLYTKEIWAGNTTRDYAAIQTIRGNLVRSMSMEAPLKAAGIDAVILADFMQPLRREGQHAIELST